MPFIRALVAMGNIPLLVDREIVEREEPAAKLGHSRSTGLRARVLDLHLRGHP